MKLQVRCSGCERTFPVGQDKLGRKFHCPTCGGDIFVSEETAMAAEPETAAPQHWTQHPLPPQEDAPTPQASPIDAPLSRSRSKASGDLSSQQMMWMSVGGAVLATGIIIGALFLVNRKPTSSDEDTEQVEAGERFDEEGHREALNRQLIYPRQPSRFSPTTTERKRLSFSGTPAAEPSQPITGYVPETALIGMSFNIPRMLNSPALKTFPDDLLQSVAGDMPIDPRMVEQIVIGILPPQEMIEEIQRETGIKIPDGLQYPDPEENQNSFPDLTDQPSPLEPWVMTIHFSEDVSARELCEAFNPSPGNQLQLRRIFIQGNECLLMVSVGQVRRGNRVVDQWEKTLLALYMPDARTAVISSPRYLKYAVLGGQGGSGPVAESLMTQDMNYDCRMVISQELYPQFREVFSHPEIIKEFPPALLGLLKLPELANTATLQVDLSADPLLMLTLHPDHPDQLEELAEFANQVKAAMTQFYDLEKTALLESLPFSVGEQWQPPMDEMIASLSVRKELTEVVLTMNGPREIEAVMAPLIAQLRRLQRQAKFNQHRIQLAHVGIAFHNYHQAHQKLPVGTLSEELSRGELSWRVALLPYLDHAPLEDQFLLDESWNSPSNRALISRMPPIFNLPGSDLKQGKTTLQVFTGPGTLFPPDRQLSFQDVSDGLGNTLLAVVVPPDQATFWTDPEGLKFEPENPRAALGTIPETGIMVILCNGWVVTLPPDIDNATLKALITPAGGEVISSFPVR